MAPGGEKHWHTITVAPRAAALIRQSGGRSGPEGQLEMGFGFEGHRPSPPKKTKYDE